MLMNIAIVIATVLGFIFPAVLIDAIRSDDEDKAYSGRENACVIFGVIVFIILLIANS
ncbi:MAG: hypothetical protein ACI4NL_00980 [Christensenellales bacterium]